MASLVQVKEELAAKNDELFEVFREAGPDRDMDKVTSIRGTTHDKVAEIRRMKAVIDELGREYDRLEAIDLIGKENARAHDYLSAPLGGLPMSGGSGNGSAGGNGVYSGAKSFQPRRLRETLLENKGYKAFREGSLRSVTLELPAPNMKALISLTSASPQNQRRDLVPMALEERTVGDLMLQGDTNVGTVEYYEETTSPVPTVANAAVAEGGTKFETTFGWTLRTETVRKIGTFVPATKESLDDVAWLESVLRGRLAFAVERVEEAELLTGSGVSPQITGLLNRSGIQTTAKTAGLPIPDAVYVAMQLVRGSAGSGFAEPTAVIFHPTNWTAVKLLRTADGIYIWGNPSDEGPDRIWGKEVRQTTAMTLNTALVGAFRPHAQVTRREGVQITLSTEHSTFFIENKVAVLAEERLALEVYRPSAFATVTALNV